MLRALPTKIGIDSRDMVWHTQRHHHRQKLRKNGQPVDVFCSPVKDQTPSANISRDGNLISQEAIPQGRGGKVFWNKVVVDAGAPSDILVQHIDRQPQVVDHPSKSSDIMHSSRASIEENVSPLANHKI